MAELSESTFRIVLLNVVDPVLLTNQTRLLLTPYPTKRHPPLVFPLYAVTGASLASKALLIAWTAGAPSPGTDLVSKSALPLKVVYPSDPLSVIVAALPEPGERYKDPDASDSRYKPPEAVANSPRAYA